MIEGVVLLAKIIAALCGPAIKETTVSTSAVGGIVLLGDQECPPNQIWGGSNVGWVILE